MIQRDAVLVVYEELSLTSLYSGAGFNASQWQCASRSTDLHLFLHGLNITHVAI